MIELIVGYALVYGLPAFWATGLSLLAAREIRRHWQSPPKPRPTESLPPSPPPLPQQAFVYYFPLLDLRGDGPFTRNEVLEAYRRRAKVFHPDHGGWEERFIALVAERDRALGLCH